MNYESLRDKDLKAKYLKQSWEPLRISFDFSNMVCSANVKNFIIDLDLGKINNPVALGDELKAMTGVVEHGLFNGMVNKVIVAGKDGVKIVEVKD